MRNIICCGVLLLIVAALVGCGKSSGNNSTLSGVKPTKTVEIPDTGQTKKTSNKTDQNSEPPMPLKVIGKKVSLVWDDGGKPKLKSVATELTGNTISGKARMKNAKADLYDKGVCVAKMVAPVIEADESNRIVIATGGVTITSTSSKSNIRIIKSEWVKWYSREDRLVGGGGISVNGPMGSIDAATIETDTKLEKIKITSGTSDGRAVIDNRK